MCLVLASIPVYYYVNLRTCREDRENVPAFSKYSYFRYPAQSVRMEVDAASTERVAILDAGAQYGKVGSRDFAPRFTRPAGDRSASAGAERGVRPPAPRHRGLHPQGGGQWRHGDRGAGHEIIIITIITLGLMSPSCPGLPRYHHLRRPKLSLQRRCPEI